MAFKSKILDKVIKGVNVDFHLNLYILVIRNLEYYIWSDTLDIYSKLLIFNIGFDNILSKSYFQYSNIFITSACLSLMNDF